MTTPDSVERVVAEMREDAAYGGNSHDTRQMIVEYADRLQALACGPQQAGWSEDPVQVAAHLASEAACLRIDNERLQAEVARLLIRIETLRSTADRATGRADDAEAALREAGRLLRIAACPNEDCEDGAYHAANGRPARCQFCCERDAALNGGQDDA